MDGITTSIVGSSVVGAAGTTSRRARKRPESETRRVERKENML